jgi:hypothetical protein
LRNTTCIAKRKQKPQTKTRKTRKRKAKKKKGKTYKISPNKLMFKRQLPKERGV